MASAKVETGGVVSSGGVVATGRMPDIGIDAVWPNADGRDMALTEVLLSHGVGLNGSIGKVVNFIGRIRSGELENDPPIRTKTLLAPCRIRARELA